MRRALSLSSLLLASSGCIGGVQPGFEAELTTRSGCGDVTFYATNEDDTLMLLVRGVGFVSDAFDVGGPAERTFELPSDGLPLSVQTGRNLSTAICTDVIVGDGPIVQGTWVPDSGQATLRIRPGDTLDASNADLILTNLTVVRETTGGNAATVERFEFTDIPVGWFPG